MRFLEPEAARHGLPAGTWYLLAECLGEDGCEAATYEVTVAVHDPASGECLAPEGTCED